MIKKLITISGILVIALCFGLVVDVDAAYNDVTFSTDTPIGAGSSHQDMVVTSGVVSGFVVGASDVTLTLESSSTITFESASGKIMSASCGGTFTAATPSTLVVAHVSGCTSSTVTIGTGTLIEVDVAADPLTAGTASEYTVTFRTVNALSSGDIIRLDFGGGFTVDDGSTVSKVAVTDDGVAITTPSAVTYSSTTKKVLITLAAAIDASSVIIVTLDSTLVTNPTTATATVAISGIDIYTTTTGDVTIDSKPNQTAFNRVIDLEPGWNVFAPSQVLQDSEYLTVLEPIGASNYSDILTLVWDDSSTMIWDTPTTIIPLTGYAIYITAGSTVKLPLDFAKETAINGVKSRNLDNKGWYLVGYMGDDDGSNDYLNAQDEVLIELKVGGEEEFTQIVDLTGKAAGINAPDNHKFGGSSSPVGTMETEYANGTETMCFHIDYGYAVFTTADSLVLAGNRDE